jgi:hypothetical protein
VEGQRVIDPRDEAFARAANDLMQLWGPDVAEAGGRISERPGMSPLRETIALTVTVAAEIAHRMVALAPPDAHAELKRDLCGMVKLVFEMEDGE